MKTMHKINTWAIAINILLFIVPWFGMLAMVLLGITQLLLAAGITINYYRHLDDKNKALVNKYWIFVLADFVCILLVCYYDPHFYHDFFIIITLFILPGSIALYFAYVTYTITRYLEQP